MTDWHSSPPKDPVFAIIGLAINTPGNYRKATRGFFSDSRRQKEKMS